MSGLSSRISSENAPSRLACTAWMPMTKKLPSPTARRMTRVWLPGRARLRTAWRTANRAPAPKGWIRRTSARPTPCSTRLTAANPPHTHRPASHEAACQLARATKPAASATAAAPPIRPRADGLTAFHRISARGLMARISSSGPRANSSDTTTPTARPCATAEPVTPQDRLSTPAAAAAPAVSEGGSAASPPAAKTAPKSAPPSPRRAAWRT